MDNTIVIVTMGGMVMAVESDQPYRVIVQDIDLSGPESITTLNGVVVEEQYFQERVARMLKLQKGEL